jgi:uncharacterized membrane protein YphA (DoxX/SURF4 family)
MTTEQPLQRNPSAPTQPINQPISRPLSTSHHTAHRRAILALRLSIGFVYLWFALVKFVPGLSPAEHLLTETFRIASRGTIPPDISRPLVATWELLIALGLLSGLFLRTTLVLLALQLAGAMAPLILLPAHTWKQPFVLTMDGQYIAKDLIVIAAAIVLASTLPPRTPK